jgi:UDP-N-acetylmuramate--alanine ligase
MTALPWHDDNPEIRAARGSVGTPVFARTEAWGAIMKDYKNALWHSPALTARPHTTSMSTHILMAAEMDPTVMIGGTLPLAPRQPPGSATGIRSSWSPASNCNSFLNFYPTVAVILDIEADHLDFFKDLEDIKASFREFASHVPETGTIIANAEDRNTMDALAPLGRPILTFGLGEEADVHAKNIVQLGTQTDFDIIYRGRRFSHITLHVRACKT